MKWSTTLALLTVLFVSQSLPTSAQEGREGVPGRRSGGGTRWSDQYHGRSALMKMRFAATMFAVRANLPMQFRLGAFFGKNHAA